MKSRILLALYNYWNEVRRERLAPRRFEIEPSRIGEILPHSFILERVDAECYRFRLAGTRLCEDLAIELRGGNFLDDWSPADRITLEGHFSVMTYQGAVGYLTMEAESEDGQSADFEVLLLPLIHSPEQVDRFLGAMAPIDAPGWLGTRRLERRRLLSHELIWPEGRPHSVVERLNRQVPFLPHVRVARIVRSDRRQFRVYQGGLAGSGGEEA